MQRIFTFCLYWLKILLIALLLFPLAAVAQDYEVVDTETHEFEIVPGSLLQFKVGSGNLSIDVWEKPFVEIQMKKWAKGGDRQDAEAKLKELQVEFSLSKNKLDIHQLNRGSKSPFSGLLKIAGVNKESSTKVDFEVSLPESIQLKINKINGTVIIDGINGNINIEQKKGTLNITNVLSENLDLKLDDVNVKISHLNGPKGVDPHMKFSIKKGQFIIDNSKIIRLVAGSKDADLYLINNDIRSGEIELKHGDFFFNSDLDNHAKIRARSESGDMYLILPETPGSNFVVETALGRIDSIQPWQVKKSGGVTFLDYSGNQGSDNVCEFFSDIGDIHIQQRWH